jgi:diguanylate cyclase (GGDEF)-like protein
MQLLVDQIVSLTEHRDRESLDVGLAETFMSLFKPEKVAIYSVVSDAKDQRWLPLTLVDSDHTVENYSPLHADFRTLEPLADSPYRWQCLNTKSPVDIESSERSGLWINCLPFTADSRSEELGVIEIHAKLKLSAQEHEIARRILRTYRNMQSMFAYSERDALTGLLNRKSFDDTFYKSFRDLGLLSAGKSESALPNGMGLTPRRRVESTEVFWLAMVDIDHFKHVNDRFGHQIGDEVLILVSRILKAAFRGYDRIYRFGGEEFVILLRCPDHEAALNAVERFRVAMEKFQFPQVGRITASVGLSEIRPSDTPEAACERADQAVYFAKHNGRNRVYSYTDLEQKGLLQTDVKVGGVELF